MQEIESYARWLKAEFGASRETFLTACRAVDHIAASGDYPPSETQLLKSRLLRELGAGSAPYPLENPVYLYVIKEIGGFVKVGLAKNPTDRMSTLQTANPRRLVLTFQSRPLRRSEATELEAKAHRQLGQHRLEGEWFRCSIADAIFAVKEQVARS